MSAGTGTQLRTVRRLAGVAPRGSQMIVGLLLVNLLLSLLLGYGWQAMTASLSWLCCVDVAHVVVGAGLLALVPVPAVRAGLRRRKQSGGAA